MKTLLHCVCWALGLVTLSLGHAAESTRTPSALEQLKQFTQVTKSGRAHFTQVVTSVGSQKKKTTQGTFEFLRPLKFRFDYAPPLEQLLLSDGQKIWLYDKGLQQVTQRPLQAALSGTPAAILVGGELERDFQLKEQSNPDPDVQSLEALPKTSEGQIKSLRISFKGGQLFGLEIIDAFGTRSQLHFSQVEINPPLPAARFVFTPPPGVDVVSP